MSKLAKKPTPSPSSGTRLFLKCRILKGRIFQKLEKKPDARTVTIKADSKSETRETYKRREGHDSPNLFIFGDVTERESQGVFQFAFSAGMDLKRRYNPQPPDDSVAHLSLKLSKLKLSDPPKQRRTRLELMPSEIRQTVVEILFGEPAQDYTIRHKANYEVPAFDIVSIRAIAASSPLLALDILQVGSVIARRTAQRLNDLNELSAPLKRRARIQSAKCNCKLCQKSSRAAKEEAEENDEESEEAQPEGNAPNAPGCPKALRHQNMVVLGYAMLLRRILLRISKELLRATNERAREQIESLRELQESSDSLVQGWRVKL